MAERRQGVEPPDNLEGLDGGALLALVEQHPGGLSTRLARQILRHPFVTTETIDAVAINRQLTGMYVVRRLVARHPLAAPTTALRFVPGLFWRDLMELTLDLRIATAVRRSAERYLQQRLPMLAVGERVALARRAGPATLQALGQDQDPQVVTAMLNNPRLSEGTLMRWVANRRAKPQVLAKIAASARWGRRYAVRVALSRNPQTPFQVQFGILPGLRRSDLQRVAAEGEHSSVVRRRARTLLEGARRG